MVKHGICCDVNPYVNPFMVDGFPFVAILRVCKYIYILIYIYIRINTYIYIYIYIYPNYPQVFIMAHVNVSLFFRTHAVVPLEQTTVVHNSDKVRN